MSAFRKSQPAVMTETPPDLAALAAKVQAATSEVDRLAAQLERTRGDHARDRVQREILDAHVRVHDAEAALERAQAAQALPEPVVPEEPLEALQAATALADHRVQVAAARAASVDPIIREQGLLELPALTNAARAAHLRRQLGERKAEADRQAVQTAAHPAAWRRYVEAAHALQEALRPAVAANTRVRDAYEQARAVGLSVDALGISNLTPEFAANLDRIIQGLEAVGERWA